MGVLISVMVAFNGGLTAEYGMYSATVIIHVVGLALIVVIVLARREWPFVEFFKSSKGNNSSLLGDDTKSRAGFVFYLGGAIGVLTTIFLNFAFGRISVSAILALGLFGQSITGLVIDQYGLLGMAKHPFAKRKLIGLILIIAGIVSMISNFEIIAVILAFVSGATIVISRTLNAKLADTTSTNISTFYNYIVGLVISIPVFLILGSNEISLMEFTLSPNWYIYLGGVLGVCVVLLGNITVMKISAFYLTLLIFIGQVFSGVLIDIVISQELSPRNLIGGVLVTLGLSINLILDRKN